MVPSPGNGRSPSDQQSPASLDVSPTDPEPSSTVLGVRGVSKRYGGVVALNDVSVSVGRNESLALIGANGAGKSTLVKVLTGVVRPDSGDVVVDGRVEEVASPRDALAHGIGIVPQELSVAGELTVAENVLTGGWKHSGPFVSVEASEQAVSEVCASVGLEVSPRTLVRTLSPAAQRLVMICRSLIMEPSTLILDEPTAALAEREADLIVDVINGLRQRGLSLIYISHRMEEISQLCDSLVVLRNGQVVMTGPATPDTVSRGVEVGIASGHESEPAAPGPATQRTAQAPPSTVLLRGRGISNKVLRGVDFEVRSGEIVGLAGLLGSGRTEILRAIAGADPISEGELEVFGENVRFHSPKDAVARGVSLIPEDRRNQGGLLSLTIRENLVLPRIPSRRGWIMRRLESSVAKEGVSRFGVKCSSVESEMHSLSGGNQQKVILARWLMINARVLLLDEPTAGIDVVAKRELLDMVRAEVGTDRAAVMVSSEFDELCGFCDRIYVVHRGTIRAELPGDVSVAELVRVCGDRSAVAVES